MESIPKIIHYCWFGKGDKPDIAVKCIKSWREWLPDYKIIEWNEENFNIHSNLYVEQAYEAKKYAFVTDYVRLFVLYNYGGIYMDIDVEVIKPLDVFLENKAFSGFESPKCVPTGIMASIKGLEIFKELLSYYDNRTFLTKDGIYDTTTNVKIITDYFLRYGLRLDNSLQVIKEFTLYPQEFFCPISYNKARKKCINSNTHTIHHFSGSWKSDESKRREKSIFWRVVLNSASLISSFLEKMLGHRFLKIKEKIRAKIIK